MRIDVERFLTITAMLAAGTAVALGCSSEDVDNNPNNDGGISGAGGRGGSAGRGGSSGSSGSAGSSGRGGTAGTNGASGSAGTAGSGGSGGPSDAGSDTSVDGTTGTGGTTGADGAACLGDTSTLDAGAEPCDDLPYASQTCTVGDATGQPPAGLELCEYVAENGRPGVFAPLKSCLASVGDAGTACSTAHEMAVQDCIDQVFTRTCDVSPTSVSDGDTWTCADVSATCEADGSTSTISEKDCADGFHAFTAAHRAKIIDCFVRNENGPCGTTFQTCVFNPDYVE